VGVPGGEAQRPLWVRLPEWVSGGRGLVRAGVLGVLEELAGMSAGVDAVELADESVPVGCT
jgi:hypothetical protein